jgi:hypothetical protein
MGEGSVYECCRFYGIIRDGSVLVGLSDGRCCVLALVCFARGN